MQIYGKGFSLPLYKVLTFCCKFELWNFNGTIEISQNYNKRAKKLQYFKHAKLYECLNVQGFLAKALKSLNSGNISK